MLKKIKLILGFILACAIVLGGIKGGIEAGIYLYNYFFVKHLIYLQISDNYSFEISTDRLPVIKIHGTISNYGGKVALIRDKAILNLNDSYKNYPLIIKIMSSDPKYGRGTTIQPKESNVPLLFILDFNNFYIDQNIAIRELSSIWFPTDSTDILRTLKATLNYLDSLERHNLSLNINVVVESEGGCKFTSNDLVVSPRKISKTLKAKLSKLRIESDEKWVHRNETDLD